MTQVAKGRVCDVSARAAYAPAPLHNECLRPRLTDLSQFRLAEISDGDVVTILRGDEVR